MSKSSFNVLGTGNIGALKKLNSSSQSLPQKNSFIDDFKKQIEGLASKQKEQDEKLKEQVTKNKELQEQLQKQKESSEQTNTQTKEEFEKQISQQNEKIKELESKNQELENSLKQQTEKSSSLEEELKKNAQAEKELEENFLKSIKGLQKGVELTFEKGIHNAMEQTNTQSEVHLIQNLLTDKGITSEGEYNPHLELKYKFLKENLPVAKEKFPTVYERMEEMMKQLGENVDQSILNQLLEDEVPLIAENNNNNE